MTPAAAELAGAPDRTIGVVARPGVYFRSGRISALSVRRLSGYLSHRTVKPSPIENADDLYLTRAMVAFELDEAAQHLRDLARRLSASLEYDDPEFRIDLGHVYAHLNRAWNRRSASAEAPTAAEFERWSQFPEDVFPVG